jgi:enamine deaminase RidA (YjgF/YER057c/UK114 family)
MLSRSNPAAVPPPIGHYHHTTTVPGGTDLVFVSGQVGHHLDGSSIAQDSAGQARQAFRNLGAILTDLSVGRGQIAKILTFVAGAEHLPGFFAARDDVFARWYPGGDVPAHSLAVVAGLAAPDLLVEIEAVVAVPRP